MHEYYDAEIEKSMVQFYDSLSEKDRRRYAAVEAKKIGHGGLIYISTLFNCDHKTVTRGLDDLDNKKKMNMAGVRVSGGGPKSKIDSIDL